jgi:hypothetical protein
LGEVTERADYRDGGFAAQLVEYLVQFLSRIRVLLATESDRILSYSFYQSEGGVPLLFSQGVTQHPSQKTDILT